MKKQVIVFLNLFLLVSVPKAFAQNVAINATGSYPDTSAILDISSTTRGFLAPRMTTTQQNAIVLPANGLLIFNTTDNVFKVNTGTTGSPVWTPLSGGGGSGITSLNGLTGTTQTFATGTSGTDFNISSSSTTHTLNIPDASATARGLITTGTQTVAGAKTFSNNATFSGTITASTLNSGASTDSVVTASATGLLKKRTVTDVVTQAAWALTGNSGTVDGTNFIGTKDNVALSFKVNNQKAGRISSTGNTMYGYTAGNLNKGTYNTGIGYQALMADTSGDFNTALGVNALAANVTGYYNTALGVNSLYNNTSGSSNTATGLGSLYSNTTGSFSTATGINALYYNTTGSFNMAEGYYALISNTTGSYNAALGAQALDSNISGSYNTAVGVNSLISNKTGSNNSAIGFYAGLKNTSGSNNTAIGYQALNATTTGSDNVAIGYNTLMSNATGSNNTVIGDSADLSSNSISNSTAIGFKSIVSCNHCVVLGDTTLAGVGIGTTSPGKDLAFGGRAARTIWMERNTIGGSAGNNLTIQSGGAAGASSDKNGGDLNVSSGIATGTGSSNIYLQTATASSSGSTDNIPTTKMSILGNGNVGVGVTPTAALHIKAGTATANTASIKVDDGTLLLTIEKGTIEKDANTFYITPDATNRGVLPSVSYSVLSSDFTLTNGTSAQNVFAGTQDAVNVTTSTYEFEAQYLLSTGTTTTRTISTLFGGTATLTNITYTAELSTGAANTMTTTISKTNVSGAAAKVLDATNTNAEAVITLKGIIRVSAAGTLIPQIQFSAAPGATNKCLTNSFFKLTPIGSGTMTSVGSWN